MSNPSNQNDSYSQLNIPKIRNQSLNAAPATPRMLRNSSNSNSINNHAPNNLSDEYTINPDYVPRTPAKRINSNIHQRQPSNSNNNNTNTNSLLPGVDFHSAASPLRTY
ncbi:hypothetical protein C6P40_003212, partial [Pichia californica]